MTLSLTIRPTVAVRADHQIMPPLVVIVRSLAVRLRVPRVAGTVVKLATGTGVAEGRDQAEPALLDNVVGPERGIRR
jgi:hypothetical protein